MAQLKYLNLEGLTHYNDKIEEHILDIVSGVESSSNSYTDNKIKTSVTDKLNQAGGIATLNEDGKIDFERIGNVTNILSVSSKNPKGLPSTLEDQSPKVKKLLSSKRIDN